MVEVKFDVIPASLICIGAILGDERGNNKNTKLIFVLYFVIRLGPVLCRIKINKTHNYLVLYKTIHTLELFLS